MTSEYITAHKEGGTCEKRAGGRVWLGRVRPLVGYHAVDLMDGRSEGAKANLL